MKSLIFVEGEKDIEYIKENNIKIDDKKIISFDIIAHQKLNQMNVKHSLVEEFFEDTDGEEIDKLSSNFATTWYKQTINNQLKYHNLELGYLIEAEIQIYFLKHIRKVVGIKRIIEKEKPDEIISFSSNSFVKNIIDKTQIQINQFKNEYKSGLEYDNVEIPLSLGKINKEITISRTKYLKAKRFLEKSIDNIFDIKCDIKKLKEGKTILLVDFNPIFYPSLLEEISLKFSNIILLNQRRPAIWNKESLKIIRNSNCRILRLEDFLGKKYELEITDIQENEHLKIESIFSDQKIFEDFFSVNSISFWSSIKKDFISIIKQRTNEMVFRVYLLEKIFQIIPFTVILNWANSAYEERIVNHVSNHHKIPILFLQHSMIAEAKKFDKFLPFQPILPMDNAKAVLWGNISKKYLTEKNIQNKDIVICGSPRHDYYFWKQNEITNNGTILLAFSTSASIYNFEGNDSRNAEKLEKAIHEIIQVVKKFPDKRLVVKLHPSKSYFDIQDFIKKIDPTILIYKDKNPIELIKKADIVIANSTSTILLESMILKKPTLLISTINQNIEEESMVKNNATITISKIEEINETLTNLLTDNNKRAEIIKNGLGYIDSYFSHQGTSSKYISKELGKYE
jgi:hypothetical protein